MPNMILKAVTVESKKDHTIDSVNSKASSLPLVVKAKAGEFYRLVDEKTGQPIKAQTLLRKGKDLQVVVDETVVVELNDFYLIPEGSQSLASLP